MNPRENLLSLLKRQGYDYPPVFFELCPALVEAYEANTQSDLDYRAYFQMPWRTVSDVKLAVSQTDLYLNRYGITFKGGTYIDPYGVAHEPGSAEAMHMTYMHHPLQSIDTLETLKSYPFPDYSNADSQHQKTECDAIHDEGLVALGSMEMTIWEQAWYLRSMEELMMDMVLRPEMAHYLLQTITENAIIRGTNYAKAGCDIIFLGDDVGMQSTTLMSEDMYVTWLKPYLTSVIDAIRQVNPDIIIAYHSCGHVTPLIPHLIEAGIDVLNPVQPESMDFQEIHQLYGDQLSFIGSIGTQKLIPFGTVAEIQEEVRRNLNIAGPKGGLLCAPTHTLEPEVPWDNIIAYVKSLKRYIYLDN